MLLQHARLARDSTRRRGLFCWKTRIEACGRAGARRGLALIDKRYAPTCRGHTSFRLPSPPSIPRRAAEERLGRNRRLYAALERMQPSPLVTLNRAVATANFMVRRRALSMITPLEQRLSGYYYYRMRAAHSWRSWAASPRHAPPLTAPLHSPDTPAQAAHIRAISMADAVSWADRHGRLKHCRKVSWDAVVGPQWLSRQIQGKPWVMHFRILSSRCAYAAARSESYMRLGTIHAARRRHRQRSAGGLSGGRLAAGGPHRAAGLGVHETARYTPCPDGRPTIRPSPAIDALPRQCIASTRCCFAQLFHPGREIAEADGGLLSVAYAPSACERAIHVMPSPLKLP